MSPGGIETPESLQERCSWDEVFGIMLPVLRNFAGRLDLSDHALAFFDREGWMLSIDGDPRVMERLEEISFQPGTTWAERSAGTNRPGTALAEGRPVEVFAAVDVRVVAATNRPLEEEIRAKRFREDLFYRLNVLTIPVPSLRDRKVDIPLLAKAFLAEAETELGKGRLEFAPDALEAMRTCPWPGNVRELRNVVLRASATALESLITAQDLLLGGKLPGPPTKEDQGVNPGINRTFDRDELLAAITACDWNLAHTVRKLGISRMTLYRWMKKHAIDREDMPL